MEDLRKSNIERRLYIAALTAGLILIGIRVGYAVLLVRLVSQVEVADTSSPSVSTGKTSRKNSSEPATKGAHLGRGSRAVSRSGTGPGKAFAQLQEYIESGDLDKAIELCEKQSRASAEGKWLAPLTWLYKETGQQEKARGCLRRVRSLHAYDARYASRLTRYFVDVGMNQEAIETAEWFLRQDGPLPVHVYGMLLHLYANQRKVEQLSRTVTDIMRIRSGEAFCYYSIGRGLLSVGRTDAGIAILQKVLLEKDTSYGKEACRNLIVQAYLAKRNVSGARRVWESSVPGKQEGAFTKATLLANEGKWKQIVESLSRNASREEVSPQQAIALCRAGDVQKLKLRLDHTLMNQDEITLWAGREVGFHMLDRGRYSDASEGFSKAAAEEVHLPPPRPSVLSDIGDLAPYSQPTQLEFIDHWGNVYNAARRNGWLGIQTESELDPGWPGGGEGHGTGVHVCRVVSGSPADRAGVRPGETVIDFSGQPITSSTDWVKLLEDLSAGKRISLTVQNDVQSRLVELTAGRCPE